MNKLTTPSRLLLVSLSPKYPPLLLDRWAGLSNSTSQKKDTLSTTVGL